MWSHEPDGCDCPFCRLQCGVHDDRNRPEDVVAVTDLAFARIAPKWWPAHHGAALVIPRAHHENLYALPREIGHGVWDLVREVTIAMRRAYGCDGTSIRQHNEPAGDQDVWHLHVHVFSRYGGDQLHLRHRDARWVPPTERVPYADQLAGELPHPRSFAE